MIGANYSKAARCGHVERHFVIQFLTFALARDGPLTHFHAVLFNSWTFIFGFMPLALIGYWLRHCSDRKSVV